MTDVIVLVIDCKWGRSLCAIGRLCRPLTSYDTIVITLITQRVMGGTYFCTTELEQYLVPSSLENDNWFMRLYAIVYRW